MHSKYFDLIHFPPLPLTLGAQPSFLLNSMFSVFWLKPTEPNLCCPYSHGVVAHIYFKGMEAHNHDKKKGNYPTYPQEMQQAPRENSSRALLPSKYCFYQQSFGSNPGLFKITA